MMKTSYFLSLPNISLEDYPIDTSTPISADEMNRAYFADISELKQHAGKLAVANKIISPAMAAIKFPQVEVIYSDVANKIISPAMAALKFPQVEVIYSDGRTSKLPITSNEGVAGADKLALLKASVVCLTFRANSQAMIDSWSTPFGEAFSEFKDVQL